MSACSGDHQSELKSAFPVEGGCVCQHIRYRMLSPPIITHCCHCTWCQRETGSAFVLNAMIESDRIVLLTANKPLIVATPTHSGEGQTISRCPQCYVAVWSDYNTGDLLRMMKVGTLDHPEACPPGVQIFTDHKQPWVKLAGSEQDARIFDQHYDKNNVMTEESLRRVEAVVAKAKKLG